MTNRRFIPLGIPGQNPRDPSTWYVYDVHTRRPAEMAENRTTACARARELNAGSADPAEVEA